MSFYSDCMVHKTQPLVAAIEKKSTGVTLISILDEMRGLKIREVKRTKASGSKAARYIEMQPIIAAKLISFTQGAKHVEPCINHMMKITANDSHRHDDICDTLYDAIKLTLIDKTLTIDASLKSSKSVILKEMSQHFAKQHTAKANSWR